MTRFTGDVPLRFGYTIGDVDRIAAYVAGGPQWGPADRVEICAIARDGAVDAILTASKTPPAKDVFAAARAAVYTSYRAWKQMFGRREDGAEHGAFRAFWADWVRIGDRARADGGFADSVVEAVAVRQILSALPPEDEEILTALAATDSRVATAKAVGVSERIISRRITEARIRALELWHEGLTPPGPARPPRDAQRPACGTRSGYAAHRTRHEDACLDCRNAQAEYMRAYKAKRAKADVSA